MADDGQELRSVNWREVFGFTRIFGSFKLSRQMSKIGIALLAVVLTWGLGLVMDLVFTHLSDVYAAPQGAPPTAVFTEPDAYWCVQDFDAWRDGAQKAVEGSLVQAAQRFLTVKDRPYAGKPDDAAKAAREDPGKVRGQLAKAFDEGLEADLKVAADDRKKALEAADKLDGADKKKDAREQAEKDYLTATRNAYDNYAMLDAALDAVRPQGVFATFSDYEGYYFREAVRAVLHGNILTGFNQIEQRQQMPPGELARATRLQAAQANAAQDPLGLLACLSLMAQGVIWLFAAHWIYAVIFAVIFLFVWSVAIGGVARAAALQATRDEKAGLGECLRFGLRKWYHNLGAMLAPIIIFLVLSVLVAAPVSLVGLIPGFGGVWIGIWFGLVMVVSFALAMLLILLVAGGLLMAPTVAVEGSDAFDAITRSSQFVLSRPWRASFYGLVAAGYGTICYLFVRTVLFATLKVSHFVVGLFDFTSRTEVRAGAGKWDLMWSGPTFENFHGSGLSPAGINGVDWFGGYLVNLWIMLVGGLLVAWVISYLVSSSTYIYLLLRRAEDATELDEVYIEEPMEDLPPEPAAPAEAAAPAASAEPEAPKAAEEGEAPKAE
ncbi:MAG: hypothetical protein BIFFINMI_03075 [Phycisphaerae bacterium]|nr:hypothetical protein [Phycisphaerae bacterium]